MRRVLLALSLAALAGALAGCGSGVKSALDPVADAAAKTQQAGGFKATMTMTLSAEGKQFTMTAHGAFAPHEGEMELDLSDLMAEAGATGVDGIVKAVYVTENGDPVMYLKLGFLTGLMPGGKPWMRMDLAKVGKAAGIDFGQLMGGAGQNPADSLQLLRSEGDFSEVGTEHVDGVDTTHYHGTIDLAKAASARGISSDTVKRLLDLGAPSQFPADVWVDDAGYVRRFASTFDETVAGKTISASMAIDMSDYGTTVDVSAPPTDQVFDATELASQGVGSSPNPGTGG